jgi:hypothetical protein
MNYGLRPTFHQDATHAVFEVHVLDRQDLKLNGERMEVRLIEQLRREQRFANAQELQAQIARDCERGAQRRWARRLGSQTPGRQPVTRSLSLRRASLDPGGIGHHLPRCVPKPAGLDL